MITSMWHRFERWLRFTIIDILADLICFIVPRKEQYKLTVDPVDESNTPLGVVREGRQRRRAPRDPE